VCVYLKLCDDFEGNEGEKCVPIPVIEVLHYCMECLRVMRYIQTTTQLCVHACTVTHEREIYIYALITPYADSSSTHTSSSDDGAILSFKIFQKVGFGKFLQYMGHQVRS
jgi:hypothetical protein